MKSLNLGGLGAIWSAPSKDCYLTIGFVGQQPELGDRYSNNGSMYITSASFLPLGLSETDSYRTAPALNWPQKNAFAGASFPQDYPVRTDAVWESALAKFLVMLLARRRVVRVQDRIDPLRRRARQRLGQIHTGKVGWRPI